jgi:hypothetical protein
MNFGRGIVLLASAALVFLSGDALSAETLKLDKQECHVDVPQDWEVKNLTEDHVTLLSPDHGKFFILQVSKASPNMTVDNSTFLGHVEQVATASGYAVIARKTGSLCGFHAQILDMAKKGTTKTLYCREMLFITNSRAYLMGIFAPGYPADQDDELGAIVNSFGLSGAFEGSDKKP